MGEYGLAPEDLIYDALTFTLATGDAEWIDSGKETVEGIRLIKRELPGVSTILGVSNVSFGLTPEARGVLNSVFLHHCVQAGLDAAIVNPAHIRPYAEISAAEREMADDLVFNKRPDALQRFIEYFSAPGATGTSAQVEKEDPTAGMTPEQKDPLDDSAPKEGRHRGAARCRRSAARIRCGCSTRCCCRR